MPSYRSINYGLRPAKAIERKMMGEAFRRLHPFLRVEDYRYVGFGSIYFSDFQLVHRVLGITDMISIEKDVDAEECFTFNRPFRSIDLKFGTSGQVLPALDWSKPVILWLDYDGKLDIDSLSDIDTFCARCRSGSMLIVSANAQPEFEPDAEQRELYESETGTPFDLKEYRFRKLKALVGEDKIPPGVTGHDLRGHGVAAATRSMIDNEIAAQLAIGNAMLQTGSRMRYRQIFNFRYRDGALMTTVGGIFYRESEAHSFDACAFDRLPFVRTGSDAYELKVPCLTMKEMRHLDGQLQTAEGVGLTAPGVPPSDLATYAEVYRYFPAFSEIQFA